MHEITLYHTSVNIDKVMKEGLKPKKDLDISCVGVGQAEYCDKMNETISTTTNLEMAKAFKEDLIFLSRIAKGEIDEYNFCEYVDYYDKEKTSKSPCEIYENLIEHENEYIKLNKYCYDNFKGRYEIFSDSFPELTAKMYKDSGHNLFYIDESIQELKSYYTDEQLNQLNKMMKNNLKKITHEDIIEKQRNRRFCIWKETDEYAKNSFIGVVKDYINEREKYGSGLNTYILSDYEDLKKINEENVDILKIEAELPKTIDDLQKDWDMITEKYETGQRRKADVKHFSACNVDGVCGIYPFFNEVRIPPKYIKKIERL